ncbi:hypothetical protein ACIOEW_09825 [Streptomyces sp. NPDC087901]|uniref:hypothetical protein n=1 Tax=Streptomyces sp. NPDC087901 TaxID=3365818 RepID=UPI0037F1CCC1
MRVNRASRCFLLHLLLVRHRRRVRGLLGGHGAGKPRRARRRQLHAFQGHTTAKSITVTDELTKKGRYWFYAGRLKASGYWQGYRCDRGTKWVKQAHGTAKTYGALVEGATRCGEKVSKKSIANLVQTKYC